MSRSVAANAATAAVCVAIVGIFVVLSDRGADTPTTPTPNAIAHSQPSHAVMPSSPTASPSATNSEAARSVTFRQRAIEFEKAYLTPDPVERLENLRPYVTDKYLARFEVVESPEELSQIRQDIQGLEITYDEDNSQVIDEVFDDTAVAVSICLLMTTSWNGKVENSDFCSWHQTNWILVDGQWFVDTESP